MKRKRSVITSRAHVAPRRRPGIDGGSGVSRRSPTVAPAPGRPAPGRRIPVVAPTVVPEPIPPPVEINLAVDLAPRRPGALVLRNPMVAAAGAFGYGVEYSDLVDVEAFGAICTRSLTFRPNDGNGSSRVAETPAGLLNGVGLQNIGVDAALERYAGRWAAWDVPVIVSVAGGSIDEYVGVVRRLDGHPGVAGIELNLSCPNAARGGLLFALDPDGAGQVTAAVRRATDLPLLAKLSPAAGDVRAVADAVEEAGADAISAVNTMPGLAIDREARQPALGSIYGGLSGPALKPIALRVVYEVAQQVRIPILASGGIGTLDDVLDYLMAGATAVAVGTALFADPGLPLRLVDALEAWCVTAGVSSPRDLIGAALPRGRGRPSTKGAEYRP